VAEPLFDRIGGMEAIMAAADLFYEKVLDDEITRPFFQGVEMDKQTQKLVAFMAWAFGGPDRYKGRDLREAHKDLVLEKKLSDVHFDAVAKHLVATLVELGVAQPLIDESLAIVASTKTAVLNR
jgi:hemoglobin